MDDHFDLVFRFLQNRVEQFWKDSKWLQSDAVSLAEQNSRMREIYERRIMQIAPGQEDHILELLRKSNNGICCG
ncbi:hypothetical protein N8766_00225 [bacterium]|nr:hypothetical protein [bacterium]MDB4745559.1 hypothetical protein [Verrucomicrobiota bacterium]